MPTGSIEVDETSENPGGSNQQTNTTESAERAQKIEEEIEDDTVVTGNIQQQSERSKLIQLRNQDIDPDDVEARIPAEKSSLKSSLKVEVSWRRCFHHLSLNFPGYYS